MLLKPSLMVAEVFFETLTMARLRRKQARKSALIHRKRCVRRDCIPEPSLMGFRAPENPRHGECHPHDPAQGRCPYTPTGGVAPCTRNKGRASPLTLRGEFPMSPNRGTCHSDTLRKGAAP